MSTNDPYGIFGNSGQGSISNAMNATQYHTYLNQLNAQQQYEYAKQAMMQNSYHVPVTTIKELENKKQRLETELAQVSKELEERILNSTVEAPTVREIRTFDSLKNAYDEMCVIWKLVRGK